MKGIIYIRVSSNEQVKGTSLEFQEEECQKYCEARGIEVLAIFREEGESAKTADRTELLRSLEFCRKNKKRVDAFVVLKVNRFARNTEDHFKVRKILCDYGITLHSVTEPIGNSPTEKFIETVLAASSEFDNALRKQSSSDGMSKRIDSGIWPWKPPEGYKCLYSKKRGLKKEQPDPPNEKTFPLIQKALKQYSTGDYSQADLVRMLEKWGLGDLRGKKTSSQFVENLLKRHLKFYSGILDNPFTGEEKEGSHKAMITKDEYHRIKLVLKGKAYKVYTRKRGPNSDFPLRGTVFCADCNRPFTGGYSQGRNAKYPYYHCYNKDCVRYGKGLKKAELEKEFLLYLKNIVPTQDFFIFFKEEIMNKWQEIIKNYQMNVEQCDKKKSILEARKKRIYDMREDGSYNKEEFQDRRDEINNEIMAVEVSLSELKIDQYDIESVYSYATNFIADLPRQWFDAPHHLRPRFQKLIFPEGISYTIKKGFRTANLGLIFELNQQFSTQKFSLVAFMRKNWNQIIMELKAWHELTNTISQSKLAM